MISPKAAVVHTRKALEFVNEMNRRSTTLYASTQDQIKEMIANCYDLIEIGQSMLDDPCRIVRGGDNSTTVKQQPDSPFVRRDEFDQLLSAVNMVAQNLAGLSNVVRDVVVSRPSDPASNSNANVDDLRESKHDEDNNTPGGGSSVSSANNVNQTDCNDKSKSEEARVKASKKGYIEVHKLEDAIEKVVNSEEYSDIGHYRILTRVIHDWFKYRIKLLDKVKSPFRYHASNIVEYIRAIVVNYGESEDKNLWLSNFSSWIKKLIANDSTVTSYALPYDVFQTYKEIKGESFILSDLGSIMWSMISESGLSSCIPEHFKLGKFKFMNEEKTCREIWELVEEGRIRLC